MNVAVDETDETCASFRANAAADGKLVQVAQVSAR
jgi:hypothetical protein